MVKNCSQMHMIYFKLYKCEVSMVGMLIRPKNTGFVPLVAFKLHRSWQTNRLTRPEYKASKMRIFWGYRALCDQTYDVGQELQ